MIVRGRRAIEFACYSAACAPHNGGGSLPGGRAGASGASSAEWRPNVSRSTPGASRVPRDTGEIMKRAYADDMGDGGPRGNDHSLAEIYAARGFHKKPQEMDKEDFDEFIKGDDVIEMWRGVDPGRAQYADIGLSYHENEYHWTGRGMFGNGTYFAAHDGSTEYAAMDARREAISYGGTDAVLIRGAMRDEGLARYEDMVGVSLAISKMTVPSMDDPRKPAEAVRDLDPEGLMESASQGRLRDAWAQYATKETTAMAMEIVSQGLDAGMTLAQIRRVTDDHGRIAALIGYDGIRAHAYGGNAAVYTVVLNRGATVVDENLYRPARWDSTGEVPGARVKPDRDWNARRGELSSLQASAVEELACYDASCRPPTSGGTGGSSKQSTAGRHEAIRRSLTKADDIKPTGRVGGQIGLNADGSIPADAGKVMRAAQAGVTAYDEQQMQRELYEARGFNGKGRVLSREEFNDETESGMEEGWRGIQARSEKWGPVSMIQDRAGYNRFERQIARDLIDGDTHYPGRGIYGNGTYIALHSGGDTHLARAAAEGYGPNLLRIGVPETITKNTFREPDQVAKYVQDIVYEGRKKPRTEPIDDWESEEGFDPAMHSAAFKTAQNLYKAAKAEGITDDDIIILTGDTGRVATILGMDGYVDRAKAPGGYVEYVIALNRTALTLDSTVYDSSGINPRHKPPA